MSVITKENWRNYLVFSENGDGLNKRSIQNTILMLAFEKDVFGKFTREDEKIFVEGGDWNNKKEKREMQVTDVTLIAGWLEYSSLEPSRTNLIRAIELAADRGYD